MPAASLLELRKFLAPESVFGAGAASMAGRYVQNLGARRALLVTDPGITHLPWFDSITSSILGMGVELEIFADIHANPRDFEVMQGAELFRSKGCDAIVAVGGGSPMDCAKGIGIVVTNDCHVLDFEGVDNVQNPGPPLICVPTTAGSSADVSQFAIINDTERKVKIAIVSKAMVPDVALIDPLLTLTMPRELTAHTGVDALTHAIEAYVSNAHGPTTDLFALDAIRRIARHLPLAITRPDDAEARAGMMLGSMYAGLAFSNAILGAVHAMAHSLGGLMDLPHGQCNAMLLDHVIDYNFDAAPERYADIAVALGAQLSPTAPFEEKRRAVLHQVRALKAAVGATEGLGSLGVTPEHIEGLAAFAMNDPCMVTNPKAPTALDIKAVYRNAL
ncbi:MAG TPA: alcohol dehydrogenase-like regulatory protein ErcA [Humidesulfovibrio sp.]|uniref:alcohol dehydrogenase-like regulatory protein ErcA n=1 Tax=Humidesulfovibrio sp. TaxID=2910988 RepID=UPI002B84FF29|nr:alcohol dehydrogenase-like regulatory protein ErcA [Humidesulfovibrio sp.]HWR02419.1 alcohol dehydrogenase-like regulatory protein ErcA [Humidesulfovibrio sp.]